MIISACSFFVCNSVHHFVNVDYRLYCLCLNVGCSVVLILPVSMRKAWCPGMFRYIRFL